MVPMDPKFFPMPRPIVICGPSGTGKSTLLKRLFADYPNHFGFSVSHTSRKPRPGEQDGIHYHFKQMEELQQMVTDKKFIEHAIFSGNFYGSSFQAVTDVLVGGKNVILDIDMQGVIQLQQRLKKEPTLLAPALYVFVAPPSYEELEKRLRNRGTENESSLEKRLEAAKRELQWGQNGGCDHIVVNNDLDTAYTDLLSILKKEKIIS